MSKKYICQYPGCGIEYIGRGNAKYCLEHKVEMMEINRKKNLERLKKATEAPVKQTVEEE